MGDNGFAFGEHGLIDKRTAYEESMRVPMLARCPELTRTGGRVVPEVAANIDVMPTVLEAAGVPSPQGPGQSLLPLMEGHRVPWRKSLLYEYYWERNYPQTPTMHAYAATVTSTSTTTASGISTSFTTYRKIRSKPIT